MNQQHEKGEWEQYSDQEKEQAFGYHLMLDVYGCCPETIDNLDICYKFLDQMVEVIGAVKQTQPYIFRTPEHFKGKEGLSGWVPIVESGISIHTLRYTGFVSIDVYSCREFACPKVIDFVNTFFTPGKIEHRFVLRGLAYHAGDSSDAREAAT